MHLLVTMILYYFQIFYPDLIDKTDTPEYTLVSNFLIKSTLYCMFLIQFSNFFKKIIFNRFIYLLMLEIFFVGQRALKYRN